MAFNAYTGSTGAPQAPLTSPRDPSGRPGSSKTLSFAGGLDQPRAPRRRTSKRGGPPGVRRRGPTPPMSANLSIPAPLPQSSLSPEGGLPGLQDFGAAAAVGRYPGIGEPGAMKGMRFPFGKRGGRYA